MTAESLRPEAALIQARKAHLLNHLEVFADTVCTPSERNDEMSDEPREGDIVADIERGHNP